MDDKTFELELKRRVGYRPATICCGTCQHYVGADRSCRRGALPAHCGLNPAFEFPVDQAGWCPHHQVRARAPELFPAPPVPGLPKKLADIDLRPDSDYGT